MTSTNFVSIVAGSGYGFREAIYQVVEDRLVIRDEGNHDNLAGNGEACEFEGMTIEQAEEKIKASNSESVGHSYDGCHACNWNIRLRLLDEIEVPAHFLYSDPSEVFAIQEALRVYREKQGK